MKTKKTRIEFEYEDKSYVLEYTADSLRKMEARGFDINKSDEKMLTLAETLFCGAFIANHDDVKMAKRKEIYKELCAACENPEADETADEDEANITKGKIERVVMLMFKEACEELRSHKGNVKWRIA